MRKKLLLIPNRYPTDNAPIPYRVGEWIRVENDDYYIDKVRPYKLQPDELIEYYLISRNTPRIKEWVKINRYTGKMERDIQELSATQLKKPFYIKHKGLFR